MGHHAADRGLPLDEIHLETGVGQIERGLHSGDSASLHEHRTDLLLTVFTHIDSIPHAALTTTLTTRAGEIISLFRPSCWAGMPRHRPSNCVMYRIGML